MTNSCLLPVIRSHKQSHLYYSVLLVGEQGRNCFPEIESEHLLSGVLCRGRQPYLSSHPAVRRWSRTKSPPRSKPQPANLSDHVVFQAQRRRCEAEILHTLKKQELLFLALLSSASVPASAHFVVRTKSECSGQHERPRKAL